MGVHWLDRIYSRAAHRGTFFREGWGDLSFFDRLREIAAAPPPPRPIEIAWTAERRKPGLRIDVGWFQTPVDDGSLPEESLRAQIWRVTPETGSPPDAPVAIHLAATGDEGPRRRIRTLAEPLAARGVTSIVLENAFYGSRRPAGQRRDELRRVSDLGAMFRATIDEARSLALWALEGGARSVVLAGLSMGGQAAALAGALVDFPISTAICLAPHAAGPVYTESVFRRCLDWDALSREAGSERDAVETMRAALRPADVNAFPPPARPDRARFVAARADGFVTAENAEALHRHWPGSRLRWIDGGHVSAFLLHTGVFVEAVLDAVD